MLVSWSLRYWTKAECCGEPVSLVGPIVLLTNFTSDHISSALGKSPSWNGSAALAGSTRRSASADSETPDPTMNSRREIAIVSSTALLLGSASHDPLLFIEPAHHYPVEGIRLVDIAEVAGVWDLLEAGTGHQFSEAAHRFFRAVWILGTAKRQCRDLNRGELGPEVIIHDRPCAAEHPRRCRQRDGVADLLPATRPV